MAIKRIRLDGAVNEANRPALVLALRLMTAAESMRSALRALARLPKDDSPATEADRYYLLFAAAGACGEAIKVIKRSVSDEYIARTLVEEDAGLAATLDQITAEPATRDVKVAMRARDKYWAHWDDDVASRFIRGITGAPSDPPILESSGDGANDETAYQWVRLAWFADLERQFSLKTGDEAVEMVQGMMELVRQVNDLTGLLVVRVLKRAGLMTVFDPPTPRPSE
ncbi:MAG: hypothetical protein EA378_03185 [Phycisphaerales bacterium]|nr:MAG: hypothetical protein EA378_03185 [Phycisphaerales bacterium]